MMIISPMSRMLIPGTAGAYEAEFRVRMQIAIARTAIAAELFRRKTGSSPMTLDELVPQYVPEVPKDIYASHEPVRYIRRDDGSFTIYSVGRNRQDDGGFTGSRDGEDGRKVQRDDFAFSIYPQETATAGETPSVL
jgi:hypothetical protein